MLTRRLKVPKDERTKQRKKIVIDSDYGEWKLGNDVFYSHDMNL